MKTPEHYIRKGFGHLSLTTIQHYEKQYEKYKALRERGKSHAEACEEIGVSDRHMYRIIDVIK